MEIFNNNPKHGRHKHSTNTFEHNVTDYDKDINIVSKEYFNIKGNVPYILSRAFYKFWEILITFDLVSDKNTNFLSAHLAEGPGSFIQAMMFYRDKFSVNQKNDKYIGITLHSEQKETPPVERKFTDYYSKNFHLHKTYSKNEADKDKNKDDGDLTNVKTIRLFKEDIKKYKTFAHIVTADGGFPWKNENFQEQEAYRLLLGEILAAVTVQAKGGHFICKFFETFTTISIKFFCILQSFYDKVYIQKPYTSRPSNSERYTVAIGFKYDQGKKLDEKIRILEDLLNKCNQIENSGLYISDIFSDYKIEEQLDNIIRYMDVDLAEIQFKETNKIIKYIEDGVFFGDAYHNYRNDKISANVFWLSTFYPKNAKELLGKRNEIKKSVDTILQQNADNIKLLEQDIVMKY